MPRATTLSLALILLSALTVLLCPFPLHLVPNVHATDRTIALIGNYYGWNYSQPSGTNPRITVFQGDVVRMRLSSGDTTHQFLVDVDGDGAADLSDCQTDVCGAYVQTGAPARYNFTANMLPGNYTYYCTLHPVPMHGIFEVRATTSSPDFSVGISPAPLSVAQGSSATATVTLSSSNGFTGTVMLSGTVSPSSSSPSVSFNPLSVTLSSGGQATSMFTVSAVGGSYSSVATGNYSVNVTATNGSISHSTSVQVTVSTAGSSPSGEGDIPLTTIAVATVVIVAVIGVVLYLLRRRTVPN